MKKNSLLVVKVLAVIVSNLSFFWAIIEFLLYLFKDKVFNWWSVWVFSISIVVALSLIVYGYLCAIKNSNELLDSFNKRRDEMPKSMFKRRLDRAMEQANKKA